MIKLAKKHHDLKQTEAKFEVIGLVTRTNDDKFLNIKEKENGRKFAYAGCTFAVRTGLDNTVYNISIGGSETENVKYGRKDFSSGQWQSFELKWQDRYDKQMIGSLVPQNTTPNLYFGKRIGLERKKYTDKITGQERERAVMKQLTAYDAVMDIKKAWEDGKFVDGTSVCVSGKVKPNSFLVDVNGQKEKRKNIRLEADMIAVIKPISLIEIRDDAATTNKTKPIANFEIEIVIKDFYEVDGEIYMTGILVGYDYIEEMEFQFQKEQVAKGFKGRFSPLLAQGIYPMICCTGNIQQKFSQENVSVDTQPKNDMYAFDLGDPDSCAVITKRKGNSKTVWMIVGGRESSIDTTSYTAETVEKAKEQLKAYSEDYKRGKTEVEVKQETQQFDLGTPADNNSFDDFEEDDDDWGEF